MALLGRPENGLAENHHRLINRSRLLGNRYEGKLDVIQGYISHSLVSQPSNNVPPHLRGIICQGGGPNMDGLHQQPLLTVLSNRRRSSTKRSTVNLL